MPSIIFLKPSYGSLDVRTGHRAFSPDSGKLCSTHMPYYQNQPKKMKVHPKCKREQRIRTCLLCSCWGSLALWCAIPCNEWKKQPISKISSKKPPRPNQQILQFRCPFFQPIFDTRPFVGEAISSHHGILVKRGSTMAIWKSLRFESQQHHVGQGNFYGNHELWMDIMDVDYRDILLKS